MRGSNVRWLDIASSGSIRLHRSGFGRVRVLELIVEVHTVLPVLLISRWRASYTDTTARATEEDARTTASRSAELEVKGRAVSLSGIKTQHTRWPHALLCPSMLCWAMGLEPILLAMDPLVRTAFRHTERERSKGDCSHMRNRWREVSRNL